MEELLGLFVELWGNPIGKALYGVIMYLLAVGTAKGLSGEILAEKKASVKADHKDRVERFATRKIQRLKDRVWNTAKLFNRVPLDNGALVLNKGHGVIRYEHPSEYKRDYFDEARKILLECKLCEIIRDMDAESNTFVTVEDRDNFLNDYATDFRKIFLSDIHKRVGHSDIIDNIEDMYITYDYIREMLNTILTEAEKSNNIMNRALENVDKSHRVSVWNAVKVFKILKGK